MGNCIAEYRDGLFRRESRYDEKGDLCWNVYYKAGGEVDHAQLRSPDGRSESCWEDGALESVEIYDERGRATLSVWFTGDGTVGRRRETVYNANGQTTSSHVYCGDGSLESWEEYDYDAAGKQIEKRRYDDRGQCQRTHWFYDGQGTLLAREEYRSNGELKKRTEFTSWGAVARVVEYNTRGECKSEEVYEFRGETRHLRRSYQKGELSSISVYDQAGMPCRYVSFQDGGIDEWWEYITDPDGTPCMECRRGADGSILSWEVVYAGPDESTTWITSEGWRWERDTQDGYQEWMDEQLTARTDQLDNLTRRWKLGDSGELELMWEEQYDSRGNLVAQWDARDGSYWRHERKYDAAGNEISCVSYCNGVEQERREAVWAKLSELPSVEDPVQWRLCGLTELSPTGLRQLQYEYDALGLPARLYALQADGSRVLLRERCRDELGIVQWEREYDAAGALLRQTDYEHNRAGNPICETVTDAAGEVLSQREFCYDSHGRVNEITQSDGSRDTFYFDGTSCRVTRQLHYIGGDEPELRLFTEYDSQHRPTRILKGRELQRRYEYDEEGRCVAETGPWGRIDRAYGAYDNLLWEQEQNATGEITRRVDYYYDELCRLVRSHNSAKGWTYYSYEQTTELSGYGPMGEFD